MINGIINPNPMEQTYNTGDIITGNGKQTVNILVTGDPSKFGFTPPFATIKDVATINVNLNAATTLESVNFSGVGKVALVKGVTNNGFVGNGLLNVNDADYSTVYEISSSNNNVLNLNNFMRDSAADTAQLSAAGAGTSPFFTAATTDRAIFAVDLTRNGTEAVSLATTGTNFVAVAAHTKAKSFSITGDGTNDIGILTANANLAGFTIDASATTGDNRLGAKNFNPVGFVLGPDAATTGTTVIKGGSAQDTWVVADFVDNGTPTITGIETLEVGMKANAVSKMGLGKATVTDVNLLTDFGFAGKTFQVNQANTLTDINVVAKNLKAVGDQFTNDVTFTNSFTGAVKTLNVNLDTTADLLDGLGSITALSIDGNSLNTLNIALTGDEDNFAATVNPINTSAATVTVTTSGFTAPTEQNLFIADISNTGSNKTLSSFDASGANTGVSVVFGIFNNRTFADGARVTGGEGNDIFNLGNVDLSAGDKTLTISSGKGADNITTVGINVGGKGRTIVQIGEGDSGITLATADYISDFALGGGDNTDSLKLGVVGDATAVTGNLTTVAGGAAGFNAALTAANGLLDGIKNTTVYTQTYSSVVDTSGTGNTYLFSDYNLDGKADSVIVLTGFIGDIGAIDIIA